MGVLLSQKISTYYERFKDIDVTFTKDMIQVTGLLTQQIHLKCGNDFWPCVVYTSSFSGAKVVANIKTGLLGKLQSANNFVSLRLCFRPQGETNTLTFFVAARVVASAPYGNSQDVNMFTIQFTNRPPDDFIEIMGRILDANVNSKKRKEDRIPLNAENLRKLNMLSTETVVFIDSVPRRCILRDVSFSGSKIIMVGVPKFLLDKECGLRLEFDDPRISYTIKGKFVRAEAVEGKKEMVALGMTFDDTTVPMGFKMRINDMLTSARADFRSGEEEAKANAAAAKINANANVKPNPAANANVKPNPNAGATAPKS